MSDTDERRESVLRDLVAAEVRALMARRRISGAELARAIGVPQASLQRRLAGRYPFDVETLGQIADYFDVPLHEFFLVGHRGDADLTPTPLNGARVTNRRLREVPRRSGRDSLGSLRLRHGVSLPTVTAA